MLASWMTENNKRVGFVNKYRNIRANWRLSENLIQICFLITLWNQISSWNRSQEDSMMVSNSHLFKLYLKHTIRLKVIFTQTIYGLTVLNPSMIKKINLAGGYALMKIVHIQSERLKRGFWKWWIRWDRMQVRREY